MKYEQIWAAVDKLAALNGLSPSGLAKKAGLDPTTFNKSKRMRPDGKKRWPSMESIYKITTLCKISFDEFSHLADSDASEYENQQFLMPLCKLSEYANPKFDPLESKNQMRFPPLSPNICAIKLDTNHGAPNFPKDSILIVSEEASIKKDDRIVISLKDIKGAYIGQFINRTGKGIWIYDLTDNKQKVLIDYNSIDKIGHILWISQ